MHDRNRQLHGKGGVTYESPENRRFFFICGLFMLSGEIWKQLTLTFILGGGQYNWWYFPFQLCSIPMYILLIYPRIRRTALKQALLTFLMCYGLLGGIAVFLPTPPAFTIRCPR